MFIRKGKHMLSKYMPLELWTVALTSKYAQNVLASLIKDNK